MHIDRAKFLILTGAIAAGCGAGAQREPAEAATGPDFDTTQGSAPAPRPASSVQLASSEVVAPTNEAVAPVPAPTAESRATEGSIPIVVTHEGVDPHLAEICDALSEPGPGCEGFSAVRESCYRYGRVMEPKAAEAAARCLARHSKTRRICGPGVDTECASEGAKKAPLAPGASQSCNNIVSVCARSGFRGGDLTKASCRVALSGYKLSVQSSLVGCMTQLCQVGPCFHLVREGGPPGVTGPSTPRRSRRAR